MNGTDLPLTNAPIIEAVLDIDCDLPPGIGLETLETAARDALRNRYPKMQTRFRQEFQIEAAVGEPVRHALLQGIEAFVFLADDDKQLVQVRSGGYSFNRLKPYTSLDDYLPEIKRSWDIYCQIASPIMVRKIQLRFINRIPLPLENGKVDLRDYLNADLKAAEESGLILGGFFSQYAAAEPATGHHVTSVLTAENPQGEQLPVIFDCTVFASVAADPANWDELQEKIQSLRSLKNRIFNSTLTSQCLNLFR